LYRDKFQKAIHDFEVNYQSKFDESIKAVDLYDQRTQIIIDKLQVDYTTKINQVDSLRKQVEVLAKEAGISKQASHFKEESKSHKILSYVWLSATIVIGALIALFAKYNMDHFNYSGDTITPIYISQYLLPRFIVLALLLYLLSWCTKNQAAHRFNPRKLESCQNISL